ncbi:RNA-directed DNA polymerase, eukaryota [Tanacetum coccineum]
MVRAKELFMWSPCFSDFKVDDYASDEEPQVGDLSKPVMLMDDTEKVVNDSDEEVVSESSFETGPDLNCINNEGDGIIQAEVQNSVDPFGIYDILNKNTVKNVVPDPSLSHPPGFTPVQSSSDSPLVERPRVREMSPIKQNGDTRIDDSNINTSESINDFSPNIPSRKTSKGGSMLDVLDDLIKVGKSMGYVMEGCSKDFEHIISSQGVAIQETKMDCIYDMDIKFMWGNSNFQYIASDSVGNSGGLLCVWEKSIFKKSGASVSDNFIALYGTWLPTSTKILIVVIYAPQAYTCKRTLWEYISSLINHWDGESIVLGDFNAVRTKDERFGLVFNPICACNFNQFISSSGLIDVKMDGYTFTWSLPSASKMSKLDQFLVSNDIKDSAQHPIVKWAIEVMGVGVPGEIVSHGAATIGCAVLHTPFKYLGGVVGDHMTRHSAWSYVIQKVPLGVLQDLERIRRPYSLNGFGVIYLKMDPYGTISLELCMVTRLTVMGIDLLPVGVQFFGKFECLTDKRDISVGVFCTLGLQLFYPCRPTDGRVDINGKISRTSRTRECDDVARGVRGEDIWKGHEVLGLKIEWDSGNRVEFRDKRGGGLSESRDKDTTRLGLLESNGRMECMVGYRRLVVFINTNFAVLDLDNGHPDNEADYKKSARTMGGDNEFFIIRVHGVEVSGTSADEEKISVRSSGFVTDVGGDSMKWISAQASRMLSQRDWTSLQETECVSRAVRRGEANKTTSLMARANGVDPHKIPYYVMWNISIWSKDHPDAYKWIEANGQWLYDNFEHYEVETSDDGDDARSLLSSDDDEHFDSFEDDPKHPDTRSSP